VKLFAARTATEISPHPSATSSRGARANGVRGDGEGDGLDCLSMAIFMLEPLIRVISKIICARLAEINNRVSHNIVALGLQ